MSSRSKKILIYLPLVIVILVGAFFYIQKEASHQYFLEIKDKNNDEILGKYQVEPQQKVSLWYIHSADGTPVTQIFRVQENESLALKKEKYEWYGAGLETGSHLDYVVENGEVVISGYDRKFDNLPIRIASTVPQVITVGDKEIHLSDLAPEGTAINISVKSSFSFTGD